MSFDVYLNTKPMPACAHCGRGPDEAGTAYSFNLTHNVNPIVEAAMRFAGAPIARSGESSYRERSWGRLQGWPVEEVIPILERAAAFLDDSANEAALRKMEPSNGWGTLAVTRQVMHEFLAACRENPNTMVDTWG